MKVRLLTSYRSCKYTEKDFKVQTNTFLSRWECLGRLREDIKSSGNFVNYMNARIAVSRVNENSL